jgi:hypothetical protein
MASVLLTKIGMRNRDSGVTTIIIVITVLTTATVDGGAWCVVEGLRSQKRILGRRQNIALFDNIKHSSPLHTATLLLPC